MELEIKQNILNKALNIVSRVAGGGGALSGPYLPILNNILIRVKDKKVSLTATNLEIAVVEYVEAEKLTEGEITVPAKLLTDFVGNLPKDENVKIIKNENKVVVKAGRYSSTLNTMNSEDFPELPEIDEDKAIKFIMGVEQLKEAIGSVIIACSNNTTRPVLTGVCFNTFQGDLYLVATDGYRLAEKKFIKDIKSELKAVVPANSLQEVLRSLSDDVDEVEILINEAQARFRIGEIEITSKLIDGSYVDYRGLIPKENKINARIERLEMQRVVKLAASFAKTTGGAINCETKADEGVLTVAAVANEMGENNSEIEVDVEESAKITINSKFLLDVLNVLGGDEVLFSFSDKIAPLVIKDAEKDDYVYIVMPQYG